VRVLLDECLPRKLRRHLPGHVVKTVPELAAQDSRYSSLAPLLPQVEAALPTLRAGDVLTIDALATP
jgi:hypothetical protein